MPHVSPHDCPCLPHISRGAEEFSRLGGDIGHLTLAPLALRLEPARRKKKLYNSHTHCITNVIIMVIIDGYYDGYWD